MVAAEMNHRRHAVASSTTQPKELECVVCHFECSPKFWPGKVLDVQSFRRAKFRPRGFLKRRRFGNATFRQGNDQFSFTTLIQPFMSRLFAIGDIHGCAPALAEMVRWIDPKSDDVVVTLGDYVDRGPDSKGVVEQLIQLSQSTQLISLIGNHEEMMLDVIRGDASHHSWLRYGGVDTLESYGFNGDLAFLPESHQQFLDGLGDFFETDDFFFAHANYEADVPLANQTHDALRWRSLNDVIPPPHESGKVCVVGHTAQTSGEILNLGHLVCIDTYCYGGGYLSALELHSGTLYQVDKDGTRRGD